METSFSQEDFKESKKQLLLRSRSIGQLLQDTSLENKKAVEEAVKKESDFRNIAMRFRRSINTLQSLISKQNSSFQIDFFRKNSDRNRNINPIQKKKNKTYTIEGAISRKFKLIHEAKNL